MKHEDYETISSIQADVLGYLDMHPDAADSSDGIRQWWLLKQIARRSQARVQAALDELVRAGLIQAHQLEDGRLVYKRRTHSARQRSADLSAAVRSDTTTS